MQVKQHSLFLSQLIQEVSRGALLPAAFQRPYVWGDAEVLALIESILAGYPIGSFLLWAPEDAVPRERYAHLERHRLGPLAAGRDQVHSLLLDGQNRLATLAWIGFDYARPVPSDMSPAEQQTWSPHRRLQLDLAARCVRFVPAAELDTGLTMPGWALTQQQSLVLEMRQRWDTQWGAYSEESKNAGLDWLDKCQRAFANARVVTTDIMHASVEDARHAFLHICKVGVPMSVEDFNRAAHWALS